MDLLGALFIQPNILENSVRNQMEWTSFGSVRQEYLTTDKIVVPSTALLYPSYKNNNQTRGGLGHWTREMSEISDRKFCWKERTPVLFIKKDYLCVWLAIML